MDSSFVQDIRRVVPEVFGHSNQITRGHTIDYRAPEDNAFVNSTSPILT